MTKHECENYGSFEDWFLNTMDKDSATTLREWGAGAGVGGLVNWYDLQALFDRFGSEIEDLASDHLGLPVWEIAAQRETTSVSQLIEALVHAAAEHLAHVHEAEFDDDDEDEDEE
jgi:hypothetical protein